MNAVCFQASMLNCTALEAALQDLFRSLHCKSLQVQVFFCLIQVQVLQASPPLRLEQKCNAADLITFVWTSFELDLIVAFPPLVQVGGNISEGSTQRPPCFPHWFFPPQFFPPCFPPRFFPPRSKKGRNFQLVLWLYNPSTIQYVSPPFVLVFLSISIFVYSAMVSQP